MFDTFASENRGVIAPKTHTHGCPAWLDLVGVVSLSCAAYLTILLGLSEVPFPVWDETYHVAAAQRYLHGIFFAELHPPLGKLLIALGELLVDADKFDDRYVELLRAGEPRIGAEVFGYRLIPALSAFLCVPMLFSIVRYLSRSATCGILVAALFAFDNAMVVQSRAALLDPCLLLSLLSIVGGVILFERTTNVRMQSFLALLIGTLAGCAVMIKVTGLIGTLSFLCLAGNRGHRARYCLLAVSGAVLTFLAVFFVHFSICVETRASLPEMGRYGFPEALQMRLKESGPFMRLRLLPESISHYVEWMGKEIAVTPEFDPCDVKSSASFPLDWPVGNNPIMYMWSSVKPGSGARALFLYPNAVAWAIGLTGLCLLTVRVLVRGPGVKGRSVWEERVLIAYFAYMLAVTLIPRQMYLYHYFPALLLSYVATACELAHWRAKWEGMRIEALELGALSLVVLGYVAVYPVTYFEHDPNLSIATKSRFGPLGTSVFIPHECGFRGS